MRDRKRERVREIETYREEVSKRESERLPIILKLILVTDFFQCLLSYMFFNYPPLFLITSSHCDASRLETSNRKGVGGGWKTPSK